MTRRRQSSLSFASIHFDVIDDALADDFLNEEADHWLGGCDRPFGRISYGQYVRGSLVGVAISASTPNEKCAGLSRYEVVELVRCSARDGWREQTRTILRNWRTLAAEDWATKYGAHWPAMWGYVSYANNRRHTGDLYRFDGWKIIGKSKGSTAGGTWSRPRKSSEPMTIWGWEVPAERRAVCAELSRVVA